MGRNYSVMRRTATAFLGGAPARASRKGWLTKDDVINTLPLAKLKKELGKKRAE